MWTKGAIEIKNEDGTQTNCKYWVKHYEEPSEEYGIDGGRISKLEIRIEDTCTCNYDRGWDIEPEDRATQLAFQILLHEYN